MLKIVSQITADTLESLFDIALRAENQESDDEILRNYGASAFYFSFGKNAAMMEVFQILGIRELYEKYRLAN